VKKFVKKRNLILIAIIVLISLLVFLTNFSFTGYSVYETNYYLYNLPDVFQIKKGEEFFLNVDFDEGYKFSDNTGLFDIDADTGTINFVPGEIGKFNVVIIVLKDVNDFHYKLVKFVVVE